MLSFCVGHRPLLFRPASEYVFVTQASQGEKRQLIVTDDFFGPAFQVPALSEYAKLFGIADFLIRAGATGKIQIFQYRKFLAVREGSQRAANQPFAYAVPPEEADALFPTEDELQAHEDAMLIGPMIDVASFARNYAQYCIADDFVAFTLSLRATIFDDETCGRFIRSGKLIPVPSLGIFDVALFLDHMQKLRAAWTHFARNFYVPREGYQQRVGGFLLERLQSFLLREDIAAGTHGPARSGHFVVVSPTPVVQPTI